MGPEAFDVGPIRTTAQLHAAYVGALDLYVSEPSEAALHVGYELGRRAVELRVTVPDLARIHHAALGIALASADEAIGPVVQRASDLLAEVLSAFEMIRRGYTEAQELVLEERRHAHVLRQLSSLLGDTSLAFDRAGSLTEMIKLVAEAAHELTGAHCCVVTLDTAHAGVEPLTSISGAGPPSEQGAKIVADINELGGRNMGQLLVLASDRQAFSSTHESLVQQLAQLAGAAIERTRLYG
jgi:Phosphoserine phosphatase RsbU, N-terminal domain